MNKKKILKIAGKIFLILAIINFLGIPDLFGSTENARNALFYSVLSETFFIPDFKTIILAGISSFLGYRLRKLCTEDDKDRRTGKRLLVGGIVCIVLTFTPVSLIGMIPAGFMSGLEQAAPDSYSTISEGDYKLYAFLGSASSQPEDVDILDYGKGYDGSAKEEYSDYKICGYLSNESEEDWYYCKMEFVLVDAEGNDILIDGEPVILQTSEEDMQNGGLLHTLKTLFRVTRIRPGGELEKFETNTIRAKDLPVQPVNFRVKSVQRAAFEENE